MGESMRITLALVLMAMFGCAEDSQETEDRAVMRVGFDDEIAFCEVLDHECGTVRRCFDWVSRLGGGRAVIVLQEGDYKCDRWLP